MNKLSVLRPGLALLLALSVFSLGGMASAEVNGVSVAKGLNGPMGVLVAPDGSIWVVDSGVGGPTEIQIPNPAEPDKPEIIKIGNTARVIRITADGTQTEVASLPSVLMVAEGETAGAGRLALLDGTLYVTSAAWNEGAGPQRMPNMAAIVKVENGQLTEVANTWDLESAQNPDPYVKDTHPFGVVAGPDGQLWVADSGGNDLLKVDPSTGKVELVAAFAALPGPIANPERGGKQEIEPVPTGLAWGKNGELYVALLPGIPFLPGSAKVVHVAQDGSVRDFATGLTMLTDLRLGPDGNLYAVSIGQFTEQGPVPNSGALIRVQGGTASEVVLDGLSFPTSLDFTPTGDAYVTINGLGAPGSGEVMLFKDVTGLVGKPLPPLPAAAG